MGVKLPLIPRAAFEREIATISPEPLTAPAMAALYIHYRELARWNERLGLIGPGTADEVLVRHYGEALAALPLVSRSARRGVDLGSGAGFPGLVLAAARPNLEMTLVEAKEKKWSFLAAAARKAALPCPCLNVRVASPLPAGLPESVDLVTVRALRLDLDVLEALARRLTPEGSMLLWAGQHDPELPRNLSPRASVRLVGGERRRILQLEPAGKTLSEKPAGERAATAPSSGPPAPESR
ncbi:MAG: class I SAM-dependent methyltransferase [Acidobacteria bacterium]|nr:class I SAM-dependent methyltransferase [Acidobacteriota bacterium]